MTELVAIDVGGTHARFALASVADGAITLAEPVTLKTHDYPGLEAAWADFAKQVPGEVPRAAAIAAAGPVIDDKVKLTNSNWLIEATSLRGLGIDQVTLINDFGAVAHAVAAAPPEELAHIAGPERPLPERGTISVVGPGTGLGVAYVLRWPGGYHVQATEGGHVGFAPQDEFEDRVLAALRAQHGRVVTERVNAGPGIAPIYRALGGEALSDERELWRQGIEWEEALAAEAVDRFCASLGSAVGDYALAHGASAVVLAGGIGLRLRDRLPQSRFAERFCAKPRYEQMMAGIPVKLIVHPQPGLYGAVAAFGLEHLQ